jgi:hypothetical protein
MEGRPAKRLEATAKGRSKLQGLVLRTQDQAELRQVPCAIFLWAKGVVPVASARRYQQGQEELCCVREMRRDQE